MTESTKQLKIEVENITRERDLFQLKFEHAEEAYAQLLFQFKQIQRALFGQRSERFAEVDSESPQ